MLCLTKPRELSAEELKRIIIQLVVQAGALEGVQTGLIQRLQVGFAEYQVESR